MRPCCSSAATRRSSRTDGDSRDAARIGPTLAVVGYTLLGGCDGNPLGLAAMIARIEDRVPTPPLCDWLFAQRGDARGVESVRDEAFPVRQVLGKPRRHRPCSELGARDRRPRWLVTIACDRARPVRVEDRGATKRDDVSASMKRALRIVTRPDLACCHDRDIAWKRRAQ